jgi:hypothetical protein
MESKTPRPVGGYGVLGDERLDRGGPQKCEGLKNGLRGGWVLGYLGLKNV